MLTIHDCTFEVRWQGWGAHTPYAERVAQATMLRLLNMEPDEVRKFARSKRSQALMSAGARLAVVSLLAKRGKDVPYKGVMEVASV